MSRLDSVGIAKQTALGTKQTTMEFYVPVESAEPTNSVEKLEVEETIGNRFPTGMDYGSAIWELNLAGVVRPTSFPRLLSAYFGAPTTTTPEGSARLHTFDPAAAGKTPVPHSILINRTDPDNGAITDLLYDAIGNDLTLSVEANSYVNFEAGLVALNNDDARPEPTVTLDSSTRFTFDTAKVYMSVNGGAEEEIKVTNWEMSFSNNVDSDFVVLGSRIPYTLKEGNATAEFKFSPVDIATDTLVSHYRRALLNDPDSVKIRMVAEGAVISGATKWAIEVIAYNLEYLEAPAKIDAGEVLKNIEVTARAAYSTGSSKFVEVKVTNNTTSY